jgi:hypothetical protein
LDIYVSSTIGPCTEFVDLDKGKKQEISVVISPLKILQFDTTLKINSGCNMWLSCQNLKCQYSKAGLVQRQGPREDPK